MKLLALTRYGPLGSSSRVRFYQYFPYLRSHGVQIKNAAFLDDAYVRRLYNRKSNISLSIAWAYLRRIIWLMRSRSFDLLWVEKELFPWLPPLAEQYLSSLRIPYVVDYDDAVFHRYDMHRHHMVRWLLGGKIDGVMRGARLVIAGNQYLAERARNAGAQQIACLPSVVDVSRYQMAKRQGQSANHESFFRVGWIGSPVTAPYLKLIREPLERICLEGRGHLVLIGAGDVDPLPGIPRENLLWTEARETDALADLDVGIMPLPDGPFERGKCGYKLIQYMAAGLPVVASPVGVNSQIVEDGRTGFLASTDDEWTKALQFLYANPEERQKMGRSGRKKAEEQYGLEVTAPRLLELLRSVTN